MLIVTHKMQFAREIAGRVLFMDEGRIIEEKGRRRRVFTAPDDRRTRNFLRKVL